MGIVVFLHPASRVLSAVLMMALHISRLSYMGFPASTVMEASPLQLSKAMSPIEVTELGMVMEVSPLQPANAELPIEVIELGIVMELRSLQLEKASAPIEVTEVGMIVFLHPKNRVLSAVLMMALHMSRLSYMGFPASTVMETRPLQSLKGKSGPIEVTE